MSNLDFQTRPILVFWESTRSCLLACKHCRAEAMERPAPGELTTDEAKRFVESLTHFGRPYPVLIMTGGDVLMRDDAFELVGYARNLGIPVGLAPSVTPRLTDENIARMNALGIKAVSISLDGAGPDTHEGIRGIDGHFEQTVDAIKRLVNAGFSVQVNTAVMRDNVAELPAIAQILKESGVHIWEVFFLVHVGRGQSARELSPTQYEDVAHFLIDASAYDITIRTVEGPFFRRILSWRREDGTPTASLPTDIAARYHLTPMYLRLTTELRQRLGEPTSALKAQTGGTRDGKGIIFVAHDGTVYPAGFLPYGLGNVKEQDLAAIYREHPILQDIRSSKFSGKCGVCEYRDICGGSRARAYAYNGDALGTDPACAYEPQVRASEHTAL